MKGKHIEIDGEVFDLSDPDGKKAAVRAWLRAKSRERNERGAPQPAEDEAPPAADTGHEGSTSSES